MKITSALNNQRIQKEIGQRIRVRRIEAKLSQKDLADKAGLSLRSVSNIENGRDASFKSITMLLRVLSLVDNLDLLIPEPIIIDFSQDTLFNEKKRHRKPMKEEKLFKWGNSR